MDHPSFIATLPTELLMSIFDALDPGDTTPAWLYESPHRTVLSKTSQRERSTTYRTYRAHSGSTLKSISCVNKRWRATILPKLFREVVYSISEDCSGSKIDLDKGAVAMIDFLFREGLGRHVRTFTVTMTPTDEDGKVSCSAQKKPSPHTLWSKLLSVSSPRRLTCVASPRVLAALLGLGPRSCEDSTFETPYHILSLHRPEDPRVFISKDGCMESTRNSIAASPEKFSIWDMPWTSMLLNEGSFVPAYRKYDFLAERPASIIPQLLQRGEGASAVGTPPSVPSSSQSSPLPAFILPPTLTQLEYVAVFPLASHFKMILNGLPAQVERLFIQLVPTATDPVAKDLMDTNALLKQINMSDLWLERDDAYRELFARMRKSSTTTATPRRSQLHFSTSSKLYSEEATPSLCTAVSGRSKSPVVSQSSLTTQAGTKEGDGFQHENTQAEQDSARGGLHLCKIQDQADYQGFQELAQRYLLCPEGRLVLGGPEDFNGDNDGSGGWTMKDQGLFVRESPRASL